MENTKSVDKNINEYISQNDFNKHKNGIVISKPGNYELKENINFDPKKEAAVAITIQSCDVTLSLSKYTLRQISNDKNTYGIVISRDVNNVKITGKVGAATVIDFTAANVRVFGRTRDIMIKNIISTQTQPRQLTNNMIPSSIKKIDKLQMNGGIIIGEGDKYAVYMQGTDRQNKVHNIRLKNVQIFNAMVGCQIVFAKGIQVLNCHVMRNTFYGMVFGHVWLVLDDDNKQIFPTAEDILVDRSRFDGNVGVISGERLSNPVNTYFFEFLSAIAHNGAKNAIITNSTVKNNRFTYRITAANHDGSENITWEKCYLADNNGTDLNLSVVRSMRFGASIASTLGRAMKKPIYFPYHNPTNIIANDCRILNTSGGNACGFEVEMGKSIKTKDLSVMGTSGQTTCRGITITGAK
uniref:Right handed beta helix domain-containing protein n=1 Tax=viral metagenome TaxID=1070528 RepID=A0A6C0CAX0_9ZZZZ